MASEQKKPAAKEITGKSMTCDDDLLESVGASFSEPIFLTKPSAIEQVRAINRRLVAQIETLKFKVEVDAKHHETTKRTIINDNTNQLKNREVEIENLKSDLKRKQTKVQNMTEENQKKVSEIQQLQKQIEDLKEDVRQSKEFADDIQGQLDQLNKCKSSLDSGFAYTEKDNQIKELQDEVITLKKHLFTMERELSRAKEVIAQQGGKLRLGENDRANMQMKIKVELAKVTQTMRNEIEKLRDVMKQQWEEMRELRQQNAGMRNDLREIRQLLEPPDHTKTHNQGNPPVHCQNAFNIQALVPALRALNKDTRVKMPAKKK